jgi:hypothetical protein
VAEDPSYNESAAKPDLDPLRQNVDRCPSRESVVCKPDAASQYAALIFTIV